MSKVIEPLRVYTTPEAADLLGVSEQTFIDLLEKKEIVGRNIGKGWKILGKSLIDYMIPRPKSNPPTRSKRYLYGND